MSKKESLKQIKNKVKNSVTKKYFDNKIAEKKVAEDKILNNLNELNNKTLQSEDLIKQIAATISKHNEEKEKIAKLKDQYNEQSDNCKTFIYWTCRICILIFAGLSYLFIHFISCVIIDLYFSGDNYVFDILFVTVNIFNLLLSIIFFIKTFSYEQIFIKHKNIINDNNNINNLEITKEINDVIEEKAESCKQFNKNNFLMVKIIFVVYVIVSIIALIVGGFGDDTQIFFEKLSIFLGLTVALWLFVAFSAAAEEWSSSSAYNLIAILISVISFILSILSTLQTFTRS